MKTHTKTFKTEKDARDYKEKIKDNYYSVRVITTNLLRNEYGKQPLKNKYQVRACNF